MDANNAPQQMRPLPTMSLQELYEQGRRSQEPSPGIAATVQSPAAATAPAVAAAPTAAPAPVPPPPPQEYQRQEPHQYEQPQRLAQQISGSEPIVTTQQTTTTHTISDLRGGSTSRGFGEPSPSPSFPAAGAGGGGSRVPSFSALPNQPSSGGFNRGVSSTPVADQLRASFSSMGLKTQGSMRYAPHGTANANSRGNSTVPKLSYGGQPTGAVNTPLSSGSNFRGLNDSKVFSAAQPALQQQQPPLLSSLGGLSQPGFVRGLSAASSIPVMTGGANVQNLGSLPAASEPNYFAAASQPMMNATTMENPFQNQDRATGYIPVGEDDYEEDSNAIDDEDDVGEGALMEEDEVPLPPFPDEEAPVVPPQHIARLVRPIQWFRHPSSNIVLALLNKRGLQMPVHKDVVEYHMAEGFLDCLGYLRHGAYFVKYAQKHAPPKERFLVVQVQDDAHLRPTPYLVWYIHQNGVQAVDKVALDMLVGVSVGHQHSHAFRRHLVSHDIIKGCYCGNHKSRLPTTGCFTLWFYDKKSRTPKSVDLLTTNQQIFDVWVNTMKGILSVNSVSLTGKVDNAAEMERYMDLAQNALAKGSDDVVNHMEGFMDQ